MKEQEEKPLNRRQQRELLEKERQVSSGRNFSRYNLISGVQKEKSERMEQRKMVVRRRKLTFFGVSVIIMAVLVFAFLVQFIAKIKVSNFDNAVSNKELAAYQKTIEEYFSNQPFERIRPNLNEDDLTSFIQKKYSEVEKVGDISISGFSEYNFKIKFRKPVASWAASSKKMYVDENGVSFEKNFYGEPELAVSDESGIAPNSGKTIASSSFLGFVGKIIAASSKNNLKITKISIPAQSLRQVQVYVDGVSYPAKMLITQSAEGQMANFSKAINFFNSRGIAPQYVDLRIEGRGYFR